MMHVDAGKMANEPHMEHECLNPKCGHRWIPLDDTYTVGIPESPISEPDFSTPGEFII
jgi:hypothetical protein